MYKVIAEVDKKSAKFFEVSERSGAIKVFAPRRMDEHELTAWLKKDIGLSVQCHFGEHECVGFFNPCQKLSEYSANPKTQVLSGNQRATFTLKEVKSLSKLQFFDAGEQVGVIVFVTRPYHDLMKTGTTRGIDSKIPKLVMTAK